MSHFKKMLVNKYEEATEAALQEAAANCGAKVYAKVSLKDVLVIDRGSLTDQECRYAFWAHFDFVVARKDSMPAFAVEFDGSSHDSDPVVRERDHKKNTICEKLGLPLFRIDSTYLRRVGRFSIIGWLAEVWFLYEDWCRAQENGSIPNDEPFLYFLAIGYDPFLPSRIFIQTSYKQKRILHPVPKELSAIDDQGYATALALVKVTDDLTILGHARCRFFMVPSIPSIGPHSLVQELAVVDAAEKLQRYLEGKYQPSTQEEAHIWRDQFMRWGALEL
jgi:hypothetical protein